MRYHKPEVSFLGKAANLIENQVPKQINSGDGSLVDPDPSYDLDE